MNIISMSIATYIITVVVSFIMEIKRELELFKDAADIGYKFNFEKTIEIGDSIDSNASKINYLMLLIPIYNLMITLERYSDYYEKRYQIFKSFEALGMLEEMTDAEKEEYSKKKTAVNALMVYYKTQIRLQKAAVITLEDGSKIWYEYEKDDNKKFLDNITIVKAEGRAAYLSEQEQKREIEKAFEHLADAIIKQYENINDFKFDLYTPKKLNKDELTFEETKENPNEKEFCSETFTEEQKSKPKTRTRKR